MSEKKTRKKRAITIDHEDVSGTELSIFLTDVSEPDIRVSFLQRSKKIYKDVIRLYVRENKLDNFDVLNYCNLLHNQFIAEQPKRINEIYQSVAVVLGDKQIKAFDIRHLNVSPYFQVTIAYRGFIKYDSKVKKQFFEKPLKERYNYEIDSNES